MSTIKFNITHSEHILVSPHTIYSIVNLKCLNARYVAKSFLYQQSTQQQFYSQMWNLQWIFGTIQEFLNVGIHFQVLNTDKLNTLTKTWMHMELVGRCKNPNKEQSDSTQATNGII